MTDTPVTQALLPVACHFCGSETQATTIHAAGISWAQVECQNDDCSANGPCRDTEAEAITAWNTRTSSTASSVGADELPDLKPMQLCGLSWKQALKALGVVDCALRRPHWCSPVVILKDGMPVIDDDGEIKPFEFMLGDKTAKDWAMVPRVDDDGKDVPLTYRAALAASSHPASAGDETREALTLLEKAAREVHSKGASPGAQWPKLAGALIRARTALSAPNTGANSVPVAWLYEGPDGERYTVEHRDLAPDWLAKNGWKETPLYARALSATPAQEGEKASVYRVTRDAAKRYMLDIPTLEHFGLLSGSPSPEPLRSAAKAVTEEAGRMTMTMRRRKIFDALAAALSGDEGMKP